MNPSPLTDGITESPFVGSKNLPFCIDNISRLLFESFFKKLLHTDFSDKTKSLTIFALRIRKPRLSGNFPDFGFLQMSDREKCVR